MSDEWVLVPRNPTNAMIRAACSALADHNRPSEDYLTVKEKHAHRWRMMVDAAPQPPFRVVIAEERLPSSDAAGVGADTAVSPPDVSDRDDCPYCGNDMDHQVNCPTCDRARASDIDGYCNCGLHKDNQCAFCRSFHTLERKNDRF